MRLLNHSEPAPASAAPEVAQACNLSVGNSRSSSNANPTSQDSEFRKTQPHDGTISNGIKCYDVRTEPRSSDPRSLSGFPPRRGWPMSFCKK